MYKAVSPGNIGHGKSFKESAAAIAKAGFEGYCFWLEGDSEIEAAETRELLEANNLKAAAFSLPAEFRLDKATYDADLAAFEGYIKYAKEIGLRRCVTWIYPFHDTRDFSENFELHRSRLKPCCEILKAYDMIFGMEFLGPPKLRRGVAHEFIHTLDGMFELCDAIGTGNVGLLLDSWHWDMAGQTRADFEKFTHPDRVVLVHINDAPAGIPVEEQEDLERKLPGATGVLRIGEFFDGLLSIGYKGPVMAEPFEPALAEMSFEDALKTTITAIDSVWPKK